MFVPESDPLRGDRRLSPAAAKQLSPQALAYLGDALYEFHVRLRLLLPAQRSHQFHQSVVAAVRAERQAELLAILLPLLTAEELEIVRRGRNAAGRVPRRLTAECYQQATGLETLLGYLYLCDPQRLQALLQQLPVTDH